jgi:hypothetical protein
VTTQLKFTGTNGTFNVQVNGVSVGTIPYSTTATTTTINNINTSGNVVVTLTNSASGNRVAIDNLLDLLWRSFKNCKQYYSDFIS